MRFLNNVRIADKISTSKLLSNLNILSVNQINAQVKLTELWKMQNLKDYHLKINNPVINHEQRSLRSISSGKSGKLLKKVSLTV